MFYDYNFTLLANTGPAAEITEEVPVGYGLVKYVEIIFPAGCAGLVKVAVDRFARQVLPTNTGGYFDSNDEVISIPCEIDLTVPPYFLRLRGYNEDDTYDHTIRVRIYTVVVEKGFTLETAAEVSRKKLAELT